MQINLERGKNKTPDHHNYMSMTDIDTLLFLSSVDDDQDLEKVAVVQELSSDWCMRKASSTSGGRERRQGNLVFVEQDAEELSS